MKADANRLPQISIVIPSLNQGTFIERTILSVIEQDYPATQIIVADGGSRDSTLEVLKKYPQVTWFSEPDKGFADAVNKGVALATGEITAIQSSDDYYAPGAFHAVAEAFSGNPGVALVAGSRATYDLGAGTTVLAHAPSPLDFHALLEMRAWVFQDAAFIRSETLHEVGLLNLAADYAADFDLWARVLLNHSALVIPQVLSFYTVHGEQRTQTALRRFADDYARSILGVQAIAAKTGQTNQPEEGWFDACSLVRQAYWLARGNLAPDAAGKLREALHRYPAVQHWPAYRGLARQVTPAKLGLGPVRRARGVLHRWRQLASTPSLRRLQANLPDPRWVGAGHTLPS